MGCCNLAPRMGAVKMPGLGWHGPVRQPRCSTPRAPEKECKPFKRGFAPAPVLERMAVTSRVHAHALAAPPSSRQSSAVPGWQSMRCDCDGAPGAARPAPRTQVVWMDLTVRLAIWVHMPRVRGEHSVMSSPSPISRLSGVSNMAAHCTRWRGTCMRTACSAWLYRLPRPADALSRASADNTDTAAT